MRCLSSESTALVQSARAQAWSSPAPMNITDSYVIAAIIISAAVGSLRGFLREAIALVTWIIALFIAWHFSDSIAPHLGGLLSGSPVSTWAAGVIIVALGLIVGAAIG